MIDLIRAKYNTDAKGFVFGKLFKYQMVLLSYICTVYTYIICWLKNVEIDVKCVFYGVPIFTRSYNSRIIIGDNCTFRSDKKSNLIGLNRKCMISTFHENTIVKIGNNSGFSGTVIGASNSIIIGDNVLSGANVLITDFDWHPIEPEKRHTNEGILNAPVIIGNNVWLGVNSIVLKGVTIGDNTVIGANSVVVKDIPENVIAAGNPCKVIKIIE